VEPLYLDETHRTMRIIESGMNVKTFGLHRRRRFRVPAVLPPFGCAQQISFLSKAAHPLQFCCLVGTNAFASERTCC